MNSVRWLSGFAVALMVGPAFGAEPQESKIILPEVEVRSGPSEQYYSTCKLHRGDPVDVLGTENGWLKIKPPMESIDWVNQADVELLGQTATVKKQTALHRGSAPDPLQPDVVQREELVPGVQLARLPVASRQLGRETLLPVKPPPTDCRYIPLNAVENGQWMGGAGSSAGNKPNIPSFGLESPPPDTGAFGQPTQPAGAPTPSRAHNGRGGAQQQPGQTAPFGTPPSLTQAAPFGAPTSGTQTTPYGAQPQFEPLNTQITTPAWVGTNGSQRTEAGAFQQNSQPIQPASYEQQYTQPQNPGGVGPPPQGFGSQQPYGGVSAPPQGYGSLPQDPARTSRGQPATNAGAARRPQTQTYGGAGTAGSTNNPYTVNRSPQAPGDFSDDPVWLQAERFESPEVGDLDSAIRCYDEVGRTYGQTDPNLALRAMNRAQYLRNQISAGVAPQGPLTRSAKPSYTDTTRSDIYPNNVGQTNQGMQRRPPTTAQSDIYPQQPGQILPNDTAPAPPRPKPALVEEVSQPKIRISTPLPPTDSVSKTAQRASFAGYLEATALDEDGKKFYRLIPDDKSLGSFIYCVNEPGVNLANVVNRHVQVSGLWSYHKLVRQSYMQVQKVTETP